MGKRRTVEMALRRGGRLAVATPSNVRIRKQLANLWKFARNLFGREFVPRDTFIYI